MERRLLLVFVLTFLVLMVAQPILTRFMKPAPAPPKTAATPPAPAQEAAKPLAPPPGVTKSATAETETVIENDLYRITFTNRGAVAKSWILKGYKDDKGKPLELVNANGTKYGFPLELWTYDEALRNKLNSALYVQSASGALHTPATITFEYGDGETSVRKTFRFDHSYVVKVETSVTHKGSVVPALPAWPAGFGDQTTPGSYAAGRIDLQLPDKVERLAPKSISGGNTLHGPFQWAGPVDQYFAAVFLPDDPDAAQMVTLRNSIQLPKNPENPNPNETVNVEVLGAAVGNSGVTSERVFVGPKAYSVLQEIRATPLQGQAQGPDLVALVDFGKWFGFIAKPLFLWLRWTYRHWVSNWGWAIMILTVVINVALLPLRISSMKAALKMSRVQPQVNAIKKKYEKFGLRDPRRQEMNREIQALFKQEKVNPMGGCFPLLIQFPFLVAFYSMLGVAIELRQASWFWVRDLSSPDPYHILPIGIIVTTLLVQKMTPTAGMDPAQQKMMTFMMPVMLGLISWNLASGLCLYWTVGNLIAIVQQYLMNRSHLGRQMREAAEKRARKKGA
jgi:YidC/Oxa1 family membrane protein insertase